MRPTPSYALEAGASEMFGGRCQGVCPMCEASSRRTMVSPQRRSREENSMALIQVKVNEGVFTSTDRVEELARLVYELLDAHADTEQLAHSRSTGLLWRAHLHYL